MEKIQAHIMGASISSNSQDAFSLYRKSHFGEPVGEKIQYSLPEALFLAEKGKLKVFREKKVLPFRELMKKAYSSDRRIHIKYPVFKDLREKGYVVKTALKFGADFRIYERGSKPGEKHAKWIVFCDHESGKFTWHEFSAKNRVAHSTKKNLLLAIVDEEGDVSYYEVRWAKP
ncbi:MAG TPA: tRNA-intron lyase [Candidatus Nanoarchaeia archaeon]|nr:tRNA-intron lyase [Candidatus Nanoarchaeia archaeon]